MSREFSLADLIIDVLTSPSFRTMMADVPTGEVVDVETTVPDPIRLEP